MAIYNRGLLNNNKGKMRLDVNSTSGRYDLVIFNVSANDAGAYICLDDHSSYTAELVVFEKYPSKKYCKLTKPSDFILGLNQFGIAPDQIRISCELKSYGNLNPYLKWFNENKPISSNTSIINGTITSTITLNADTIHSPSFICRVSYDNDMVSIFNWSTTVYVTELLNLTTTTMVNCTHTHFNCSEFSEFSCNFTWMNNNNKTITNDSRLYLDDLPNGNYTCIASCSIRNTLYSIERERITCTCFTKNKQKPILSVVVCSILGGMMICILIVLGITIKNLYLKKITPENVAMI